MYVNVCLSVYLSIYLSIYLSYPILSYSILFYSIYRLLCKTPGTATVSAKQRTIKNTIYTYHYISYTQYIYYIKTAPFLVPCPKSEDGYCL